MPAPIHMNFPAYNQPMWASLASNHTHAKDCDLKHSGPINLDSQTRYKGFTVDGVVTAPTPATQSIFTALSACFRLPALRGRWQHKLPYKAISVADAPQRDSRLSHL